MRVARYRQIGQNDAMSRIDPALFAVVAGALAAGVAVPWAWDRCRDHLRRRAVARSEADRLAHRAKADRWWRQNSHSTMPHSRLFESAFDDPGRSVFRPSQHP